LFAKRAEMVKDANDRYAGVETAHLLQRLESHEGIVILATNMKQNMDEAFVRRLRFIIHFPFPSDEDRERIWRQIFPADTPLAGELDFRWLARKLKLTAGHIKNISLRAAFLAVDGEGVVTMNCILEAARREMEKFGKVYDPADYRAPGIRAAKPAEGAVA
jgi:SpoVK/Ycf46/Vps4 family AAA+-type ATPase